MTEAAQAGEARREVRSSPHWLDLAYARFSGRGKMFSQGFGDPALLRLIDGPPLYRPQAALIAPRFDDPRLEDGLEVRDGSFPSPVELLPAASRTAHLRWLRAPGPPRRSSAPARADVPDPPRRGSAVVLAGSREAGFRLRTAIHGPLARQGVDLFLLEAPYYGLRAPPEQEDHGLATAAEQALLVWGMAEEARGLLAWLLREGRGPVVVAGYSMGGFVAAAVGSLCDHAVGVAALAAGVSPASTYTRMLLSRSVDWDALARGLSGAEEAKGRLHRLFDQGSSARLPPPRTPQAAVLIGCSKDGYVPAEETQALAARYPGARLRWLDAGHLSAVLTQRRALRAAVLESLERTRVLS